MSPTTLKRICVFCGSSPGRDPEYLAAAGALGRGLAQRGIGLVYGGASVGLMGAVADAARAAGGEVIGVIPQALVDREVAHHGLSDLRVVGSMHQRKAHMAELSDAFVALPGGIGTLEELFEIWTWSQLGDHAKPCAVINVRGYYDALLGFLDHSVTEGFLRSAHRELLIVAPTPDALFPALDAWRPPATNKWIEPDER